MGTDNRRCIQVLIAFMFASTEELGYDNTVQLVMDQESRHYIYQVGDRFYKIQTTRCIFEHGGTCVTGRATRVWEVVRVKNFNELAPLEETTYALKNVWLDGHTRTERAIQNALFDDLDAASRRIEESDDATLQVLDLLGNQKEQLRETIADRKRYKEYFLTIEYDWIGPTSKPRAPHAIPAPDIFDVSPTVLIPPSDLLADATRSTPNPLAAASTVTRSRVPPRAIVHKYQYRVVFKEVGEALHDVEDIGVVLKVAEYCLFSWVHRDISTGNIISWNDRGLLADLECARRFEPDAGGSADPKTVRLRCPLRGMSLTDNWGTAFFMAVEIQKQQLVYRPTTNRPHLSAFFAPPAQATNCLHPPVIHNYEHDLESLFWVLLWTYLARLPHPLIEESMHVSSTSPVQRNDPSTLAKDSIPNELHAVHSIPEQAKKVINGLFQSHSGCPPAPELALVHDGVLSSHISPVFAAQRTGIAHVFNLLVTGLYTGYVDRKMALGVPLAPLRQTSPTAASRKRLKDDDEYQEEPASEVSRQPPSKRNKRAQTSSDPSG